MGKTSVWKLRKWYKEKSKDEESDAILIFWGIVAVIVIIILWLTTMLVMMRWGENYRGTFGDMFGTINALFSGFAFAGIIFTILLQRKELSLQREELKATRGEFTQQNATLRLQRFENTFFNLIDIHHNIVRDSLSDGNDALENTYHRLITILGSKDISYKSQNSNWEKYYISFFENQQSFFSKYFRNLYRIVLLIHETDLTSEIKSTEEQIYNSKYKYAAILRAQLSDFELIMLSYNCSSVYGKEKFKPLINHYAILNNMPRMKVIPVEVLDGYEYEAFERKIFNPPSQP